MDLSQYQDSLSTEAKGCINKVQAAMDQARPVKQFYTPKWDESYEIYRNHKTLRGYLRANPRDRDTGTQQAIAEWGGADLAIPLVFGTIETIVPRLCSNPPTMTVKPRDQKSVEATKPLKELLEQQQTDIDYELKLEPTIRRALKYGIGVQKTFWETKRRRVISTSPGYAGTRADEQLVTYFDGPQVESVDIWDFFWDPMATSVETARWLIHRTWRDLPYITERIMAGDWFTSDGEPLEAGPRKELLEALAKSSAPEDDSMARRRKSIGLEDPAQKAGRNYEVLEYHDRTKVYTLVNRQFLAQHDINPFFHRDLPFQICRPTVDEDEFVGISEVEPVKHLALEMNTLRSQRRDSAAYILDPITYFADGMMDMAQVRKRGPGAWIPAVGDPREIIWQEPPRELPSSAYREGDEIRADFDRTTGIDDSISGGGDAGDTATATELIQQAGNVRIAHKGKKVAHELARPAARQFVELDRQFFFKGENSREVRIDDSKTDEGYRFETITRAILDANVEVIPDAGSMEPENKVQKRNDALTVFNQLNGNEAVDQRQLVRYILQEHDIADADAWLAPEQNQAADIVMAVANGLRGIAGPDGEPAIPDDRIEAFIEEILQDVSPPGPAQASQNGAGEQVATPA